MSFLGSIALTFFSSFVYLFCLDLAIWCPCLIRWGTAAIVVCISYFVLKLYTIARGTYRSNDSSKYMVLDIDLVLVANIAVLFYCADRTHEAIHECYK
jgi:hypothetical protein